MTRMPLRDHPDAYAITFRAPGAAARPSRVEPTIAVACVIAR